MQEVKKRDLHMHSWCSDGEDSPTQVVRWAKEQGIQEIALTDHDNTDGVAEAMKEAGIQGILFHTGIEFSTEIQGHIELHILGYDIDIENSVLQEACQKIREKRNRRNEKMMTLLHQKFGITREAIIQREGQSFIGKPVMARALVREGCVKSYSEAFEKVFETEEFKKIKKEKISAFEAIDIIKEAGGMAVLAHPGIIKNIGPRQSDQFRGNFENILEELVEAGLDGLECIYRKHFDEENSYFVKCAEKHSILITEGSDYHGVNSL